MLILDITKEELFAGIERIVNDSLKSAIQEISVNDTLITQKEAMKIIGRKYVYLKSLIDKGLIMSPDGKAISLNSVKKFLNQNKTKK